MAASTTKKGAKKSSAKKGKPKKAAKPKAQPEEALDPGVGAAGVEEPTLHAPPPAMDEEEEPDMADEPETPSTPDPEPRAEAQVESPDGTVQVAKTEEAEDLGDNPVHLVEDEPAEEEERARPATTVAKATGDIGIPEQFLTIAIDGQWDDRMERVKPGRMGAALASSLLLELAVHGKLRVQRDHFVVEEGATGDADLDALAQQVEALGPIPTAQILRKLGKKLTDRIRPWKARAERRGWLREERRKFLGLFPRSTTYLLDAEAQGKLQNRLVRMLAGGGNPDVKSVALLGLIHSAGLLGQMVPSSALAFNEKRISLLLSGRDPLHYRVDASVTKVQDACLRAILADVRKLR